MAGVMYLGNQMVSPVIVKGNEYVGRELTDEGKYQIPDNLVFSFPKEVKDIGDRACRSLFEEISLQGIDDSSLEKVTGNSAFISAFWGSLKNTTAHFRNIETITGNSAFASSFRGCEGCKIYFDSVKSIKGDNVFYYFAASGDQYNEGPSVEEAYFDNLEEVEGNSVFWNAFSKNSTIKKLEFKKLKTIKGEWVFGSCCSNASLLEEFIMDALEEIGDNVGSENPGAFYYAFVNARKMKKISFGSLKTVGINGLSKLFYSSSATYPDLEVFDVSAVETAKDYAFRQSFQESGSYYPKIPKLTKIFFNSLKNIQYQKVFEYFAPESLKTLVFKALNENSFGNYTNQFTNMLAHCVDCTVYFPSALETVIGNWADVLAGFGGTNTSVVFALPMALTLDITPNTTNIVYNGIRENNHLTITPSTSSFVLENENKNVLYYFTDFVEDGEETLNIDMEAYDYIKITINDPLQTTGRKLSWNGLELALQEETEGVYSAYVNNVVGATLTYQNDGTTEYKPANQDFQTTGNDLTITITPVEREERAFTRPNLTSNGVLGGNNFAVDANEGGTTAYRAVDSSTSTYWQSNYYGNPTYTIYNPYLLSVSRFVFTWYSSSYRASKIVVYASNDNQTWDNLGEFTTSSSSSYTLNVSDVGFYKYYKFAFTRSGAYVEIKNIAITGTEKY